MSDRLRDELIGIVRKPLTDRTTANENMLKASFDWVKERPVPAEVDFETSENSKSARRRRRERSFKPRHAGSNRAKRNLDDATSKRPRPPHVTSPLPLCHATTKYIHIDTLTLWEMIHGGKGRGKKAAISQKDFPQRRVEHFLKLFKIPETDIPLSATPEKWFFDFTLLSDGLSVCMRQAKWTARQTKPMTQSGLKQFKESWNAIYQAKAKQQLEIIRNELEQGMYKPVIGLDPGAGNIATASGGPDNFNERYRLTNKQYHHDSKLASNRRSRARAYAQHNLQKFQSETPKWHGYQLQNYLTYLR